MNTIFQNIDPSLAYALGWTIIHSFWQAALVALFMSLILRFSNHKSATFKYGVSVFSMITVLVISAITFGIYYTSTTSPDTVVPPIVATNLQITGVIEKSTGLQAFFTQNIDHINLIWGIGVMLFLARFIFSYLYTKYLKSTAIFTHATDLNVALSRIKKNLLINKTIEIAESAKINVPLVVGHLKPIILFPVGIVNMLSTDEVEAIIIHELAHIKRYDYLTNILLTLIEILFYFHPAVWWISANVKAERENCCDDYALSQKIDKVVYAKALVKLEEIKSSGIPALAMPFSSKKHQLLNRIKRIMNMPQTQNDIKEKSIATILLLSIVLLFNNQAISETMQSDAAVKLEEIAEDSKITGDDEMVLKVKKGKLESLKVDNQEIDNEIAEKVASTIEKESNDERSYTMTVKDSPVLEIIDDKVHIKGQGGVYYESDDIINEPEIKIDTIPGKKMNKSSIITQHDGKTIEIEKENGEITKLKIDG